MMNSKIIAKRFRGFFPVVVDLETGGLNSQTDALLEMAFVTLNIDENGMWHPEQTYSCHVLPFEGANLEPKSLAVNKIDPYHPFRFAISEMQALKEMFAPIHKKLSQFRCQRAVLVGHNPWFDLSFLQAAVKRCQIKNSPFHRFTTFDTATLAAMAYGETILVKAALAAGIEFDHNEAHSAIYDAEKTAQLFCKIINLWQARNLF
jgi:ribonuclease T